jgi:hypothetical protein
MYQDNVEAVTERVASLLKEDKSLRDDDRKLWITYLDRYYSLSRILGSEAFENFKMILEKCPSYETVRRSRQKLQESGKYLGKNRKKRNKEIQELREYSRKTPEQIFRI